MKMFCVMVRYFFLFVIVLFHQNLVGQDFIKYIFYENHIKVLIPKKIEENNEGGYIQSDGERAKKQLKFWNDKHSYIICLESDVTDGETLDDLLGEYAGFWEYNLTEFKNITQELKTVNREKIAVFECTGITNGGREMYILSFLFVLDDKVIYFQMDCPIKKMKKYKPLFWDVLRSIEIT
jgi:hypothetical protein